MAQKSSDKWKSKMWFNVYPPKIFGESAIGEIPANDEKGIAGRLIKVSMSWITHKPEHSFMLIGLRVFKVNGNNANTELDYIEQTYSYIHSLVRRHSSVIYTVDSLNDKNGRNYSLKMIIVTSNKIRTPKKAAIRKAIAQYEREFSSAHTFDETVNALLDNSFQSGAVKYISNIASISKFELKKLEL